MNKMQSGSETLLCSRVELVQWVNDILHTSYSNLNEIAASTLALLLYGIFCHSSPFIHRQLLSVLQQIDFTNGAAERATENKYTTIVLRLINNLFDQKDSNEGTQAVCTSSVTYTDVVNESDDNRDDVDKTKRRNKLSNESQEQGHTNTSNQRSLIDLSVLSVNDWIDGRAFVEELCVWRWLHQVADTLKLSSSQIYKNLNAYVNGNMNFIWRQIDNKSACPDKQWNEFYSDDDDDNKENVAPMNKKARIEQREDKENVETSISQYLHTRSKNTTSTVQEESNECTSAMSESNVESKTCGTPVITQDVSANVPHLVEATHTSAINFAKAIKKVANQQMEEGHQQEEQEQQHSLQTEVENTEVEEGESIDKSQSNKEGYNNKYNKEGCCNEDKESLHASLHVTDLADAMKTISSFGKRHSCEKSTHINSNGNGSNESENEENVTNHNNSKVSMTERNIVNDGYTCTECPLVFAHALECNLNLIAQMEETRKEAIAACKKRDALALLRAFSKFA